MMTDGGPRSVCSSFAWPAVLACLALGMAGCGGSNAGAPLPDAGTGHPDAPPPDAQVTLDRIEVTPAAPVLPLGMGQQLTATGVYSDARRADLTSMVQWASDYPDLVTVSATGRAVAVAVGSATVIARLGAISGQVTVQATDAVLASIELTPPSLTLPRNRTGQLTATATFSDMTTHDVTAQATWQSSAPDVATVSATGLVLGVDPGTAQITAMFGGKTAMVTATVTPAVLASIAVTPPGPRVPVGHPQPLTATGTFSDNTTRDLTDQVTWASDTPGVASVSNADGTHGVVTALAPGDARITATLDGIIGAAAVTVVPVQLVSIAVTPTDPRVPLGRTQPLTATGTFDDATTRDLTDEVVWTSEAPGVAGVSNASGTRGVVTALALGSARITATLDNVVGATTVTVTDAALVSIAVTPPDPRVPAGRTQPLAATGTFSDTTTRDLTAQVTWASDAPSIASVSNAADTQGLVSARTTGAARITATLAGQTGATTVTVTDAELVSLAVAPDSAQVALGRTQAFTATGTFSDGSSRDLTDQVTWETGDFTIALISNAAGSHGVATTLKTGTTPVRALLSGQTGTASLTVTDAVLVSIAVTPPSPRVAIDRTLQFTATGTFSDATTLDLTSQVTWASDSEASATISNATGSRGLATARALGTARITATLDTVTGAATMTVTDATLTSIAVAPSGPFVPLGRTQAFTATGTFSDASTLDLTTQVTWASESTAIAQVSNADGSRGVATTRALGTTHITATLGNVTGTATLTVTDPVLVSIRITPRDPSLALGRTLQLIALGTLSDGSLVDVTTTARWASVDSSIASVSNGLVTARGLGTTAVGCAIGGINDQVQFTVTPAALDAISVFGNLSGTLPVGSTLAFTATGTFSDRTTRTITNDVTWSSSLPAVATVSNAASSHGVATGVSVGTTSISATLDGVIGAANLQVIPAALVSIALAPSPARVVLGRTLQLIATGTFTDGSSRDVTNDLNWSTFTAAVADVSNTVGTRGLVTSHSVGQTLITAQLGGLNGVFAQIAVDVTAPLLTEIAIAPAHPIVQIGATQAFTATGVFSDGTSRDVSGQVSWASSDPAVATIAASGLATALAAGATTITAALGNVTGTTTLTVTAAAVVAIAVTPSNNVPAPLDGAQQLTATGTLDDGSTLDLTQQVTWSSADPTIAQVSNSEGSRGVVTGRAPGTTTITAALGGVTGTAQVFGALPYLKASNTDPDDNFGTRVALSADGSLLVVGAPGEASAARGINGNQLDNSAGNSGAVYVFARSGLTWVQQAYLKASNTELADEFGFAVALSADGSTLVVGAPNEDSAATGIGGNQADNSASGAGAVYVFTRSGATWTQAAYVKASNTGAGDGFGIVVAVSRDGATFAVSSESEDSGSTGIDGDQTSNAASGAGAVYVFARSGATWAQQAYVKASNTRSGDLFGGALALSGDGATLAVGAAREDSAATGVNGNQGSSSAQDAGAVYVFVRSGTTWTQQAYVKASNTGADDLFGTGVALSGDGATLAVGAINEASNARGVNGNQANNNSPGAGAVYVFLRVAGRWEQQAYLKASNTDSTAESFFGSDLFGSDVALSEDGATLAVGAPLEDGASRGVDGDQANTMSTASAGAVYLFTRSGSTWSQKRYLKASNTSDSDEFGFSVALSAGGTSLAVSAPEEGGAGTGVRIDQPPTVNAAPQSGAVYVFH